MSDTNEMNDGEVGEVGEVNDTSDTAAPVEQDAGSTTKEAPDEKSEKSEGPDYSYVPQKFLKADGSPDFEKLAKSYTGLEKKLGSKPNVPAGSADEYEYDFGDEFVVDAERTNAFKEMALEKGFTKDQFSFLMEQYKGVVSENTWSADRVEATLKEAWGKDFDAQTQHARAGFNEFAPSDSNPNDPVWNHPAVMKLLARIGSEVHEDSVSGKPAQSSSSRMSEAEVQTMMGSKEYQQGNREMHAKVTAWYQGK